MFPSGSEDTDLQHHQSFRQDYLSLSYQEMLNLNPGHSIHKLHTPQQKHSVMSDPGKATPAALTQ